MNYKSRFVWTYTRGLRSETAVQFIKCALIREALLDGHKYKKHEVAADVLGLEFQMMTDSAGRNEAKVSSTSIT